MIVVTGGAGFIGSVMVSELNALGLKDILIVDQKGRSSAKEHNLKKLSYQDYLESDVFIKRIQKNDFNAKIKAIFHQGACSSTTETDLEYLKQLNTDYTRKLAEWAVHHNVYFSYASSAATYGSGEAGYSDEDGLTPRLKSLNPYGQSKLDFDRWAIQNAFHQKITGFRYFNVYGPNEYHKGNMRSMVHKGFEQIRDTGTLKLFKSYKPEYPDGGQKRDFIYVKDAVRAVLWFYEHPHIKGIYNIGAGRAETWNDLAESLFEAMGRPVQIEYTEMPDSIKNQYQYFTEADLTKLRAVGCPVAFRGLREGVKDYVRNYLATDDPYLGSED